MAALCNRAGHYIFVLWFLFSFFLLFSSPNLSGRRLDVLCLPYFHTWCGLRANLECRSKTCCTRLAENTGRKKSPKIAICAPSHNFVGPYLRNYLRHISTIGKQLLSINISSTCSHSHNMVNFGPLAAEIGPVVWDTPANFNGFRVLAPLLHGTVVVGVSQTLRR